jgi:flavin-dependent dehydrogenase
MIAVVGGGPAGAVLALRLTRLGHRVTIYERARFPRPHVGESLGPGIGPLLDALDLRDCVLATSPIVASHSLVRWSSVEVTRDERPSLLVDRAKFDAALLECARAAGAMVVHATALAAKDLDAEIVVDASGRAGWLRGARETLSAPTLALFAYFRGLADFTQPRIEALDGGWLWGAPIPDGTVNVMAFVDPGPSTEARFTALLAQSTLFRECLHAERATPLLALDATARAAVAPIGRNFVRIGEASHTLDPLSASGVQSALSSALHASIAIHTMLTLPERTNAAIEFYADAQHAAAHQHAAWAGAYYASATNVSGPFWQSRSLLSPDPSEAPMPDDAQPIIRSQDATIRDTPIIDGDVIDLLPAVHHANLDRPLAWLGGVAVAPLLAALDEPLTLRELVARWSGMRLVVGCRLSVVRHSSPAPCLTDNRQQTTDNNLDPRTAERIARWLLRRRILETV